MEHSLRLDKALPTDDLSGTEGFLGPRTASREARGAFTTGPSSHISDAVSRVIAAPSQNVVSEILFCLG